MNVDDTIAAIASPPGGALRGIVRMSGPDVVACLERCFRLLGPAGSGSLGALRRAVALRGHFALGPGWSELPCDLYFWPGPRSFTRQTVAELHTLGSPPLLQAVLHRLCESDARLAQPGEFTLRAFLAGRIDLTQAEAVLGVIDARSRRQLDVALVQLAGGLAQPLQRLRTQLLDLLADVEAGLDFVDEDIEFVSHSELTRRLAQAADQLADLEAQLTGRAESSGSFRVALIGWPNVGKSSLFNALAGETAAIVAVAPGTTRDYVSRRLTIGGLECLLIDTAGVEPDSVDDLALAAQALAQQQTGQAHLQVWCIDATRHLNAWERRNLNETPGAERLLVLTKTDQLISTDLHAPAVATSSRTGRGVDALRQAIFQRLAEQQDEETAAVAGTALRCRDSLRRAAGVLCEASRQVATAAGNELVAADLREALDELAGVVGAVYTDDLLDRIFSRFCIGK